MHSMAAKSRAHDGGIALQLQRHNRQLRKSQRESAAEPPTTMGSFRLQEAQELVDDDVDCYSDCGYPTRPRPKVVLSVARPGSAWSAYHASKLQTVPIRVGQQHHKQHNGTVARQQRRVHGRASSTSSTTASSSSPFQTVRVLCSTSSTKAVKTNTATAAERKRRHQRRSVGAKADVESSGCSVYSESEESSISTVGRDKKFPASGGRLKTAKDSVAPLEPPALTRVKKDRLGLSLSWPSPTEEREEQRVRAGRERNNNKFCTKTVVNLSDMSNYGRTGGRKANAAESKNSKDMAGSRHASSYDTSPRPSSKKTRKPSRALTFSFGASSDRVRKGLGFLHSKMMKKQPESESSLLKLPEAHLATPNSPILQSKQKSRTLPAISRSTEFQRHSILEEERDSDSSGDEDWGPNLSHSHHNRLTGSRRLPPPGSLVINPSHSLPSELTNGTASRTESPNFSPSSTFSSRRESFDSQSSSPASRQDSPNILTMPKQSRRERRKFSDPDLSDRDSIVSNGGEPPTRGTTLKKRYTFCVRPTKQSPRPGWKEMRHHVVRFLLETEQSYVESLSTILKVYLEPLKRSQAAGIADPSLVKDIFYQIPEIHNLHERFLYRLRDRVEHWDINQKIGDIFVNTFSKCQLMDVYSKFIGNFMRAKAAIEIAKQARPVFAKFLDQRAKDSQSRLALDDLLIKPVQRIPRYVLFIKDLLKHTAITHPDHAPLQQALGELTTLVECVNASERERDRLEQQKELMMAVDGLAHLLNSQSRFVRYDMVTEIKGTAHKKDRFLILFSDVLVCASSRRKSTGFKRSSLLNLNSVFTDALKYHIRWHVPLTDVSIAQIQAPTFNKRRQNTVEKQIENLQKDEATLRQMLEMSSTIHRPHQPLVITLKDMMSEIRDSIAEKKSELDNLPLETSRIDLISYASTPPCQYALVFPSQRIKNSWEQEFLLSKTRADQQAPPTVSLAPPTSPPPTSVGVSQALEFAHPILLQSGRVGTKITCAAVGIPVGRVSSSCLWLCCSDGFGGQVCILDLQQSTQPEVVANITVSDSPILSVAAIPTKFGNTVGTLKASTRSAKREEMEGQAGEKERSVFQLGPTISITSVTSSESRGSSNSSGSHDSHVAISRDSSMSSVDDAIIKNESPVGLENGNGNGTIVQNGHVPEQKSPQRCPDVVEASLSSMAKQRKHEVSTPPNIKKMGFRRVRSNSAPSFPDAQTIAQKVAKKKNSSPLHGDSSAGGQGPKRSESTSRLWSPLSLLQSDLDVDDGGRDHCMWLGTEAGQILIYSAGSNLRSRSNRECLKLAAPIHCIRYFDCNVFIGLGNGTLAVFDPQNPVSGPRHIIAVGSGPVLQCLPVEGELWVACDGTLHSLQQDRKSLKAVVDLPSDHKIQSAVAIGNGVWVSGQGSPILHLFHAPSGILIASIDCTAAVMELLKPYNPIIRQHKSSALQVTCLHSTPHHLVAGTSSGAVVTLPLPPLDQSPHSLLHLPVPTPLAWGHVDPVHFLTSVKREDKTVVVTGGNGCEDYVTKTMSQDIPETSSCLLLWT